MHIGIATDHGGFALKQDLMARLRAAGHDVADFGADTMSPEDDYPDFVIALAQAVAAGTLERGVAICGSGVGASICANKIPGVRAGLIHDHFSAVQGVEDDHMNVICIGGRTVGAERGLGSRAGVCRRRVQSRPPTSAAAEQGGAPGDRTDEGTPMVSAPLVYTIWNRVMRFDPEDPIWPNRDRFVLSNGHASMLLWSVLHLTGTKAVNADYEQLEQPSVSLDDIRRFRQIGSKAPGHPEYQWVSGVETTTGPLGQGAATSVGMAIAGKWLADRYN